MNHFNFIEKNKPGVHLADTSASVWLDIDWVSPGATIPFLFQANQLQNNTWGDEENILNISLNISMFSTSGTLTYPLMATGINMPGAALPHAPFLVGHSVKHGQTISPLGQLWMSLGPAKRSCKTPNQSFNNLSHTHKTFWHFGTKWGWYFMAVQLESYNQSKSSRQQ